ncbi:MAG: BamA/TamA family outer membrane protein [Planctomycetota bacterium]
MSRRRGVRLVWGAALCALLGGCNVGIPRGGLSDFFVKDYSLPAYDQATERLGEERRRFGPDEATGGMGGVLGASGGGTLRAWQASVSGATGGIGGLALGQLYVETQRREPLPEAYPALVLALPIIATDPNKGPTFGLLPPVIMKEGDRLTNILAPDLVYNEIDGVGGNFRMRRFFSFDSWLVLDAGATSEGAHEYDFHYAQRRLGPRSNGFFRGRLYYLTSLANRFFGLGNETDQDDESTYVFRRGEATAALGLELPYHFSVELQERLASYKVGPGRLDDVRSTRAAFPTVDGVRDPRLQILTHKITLRFDTRDSPTAPTRGLYAEANLEISDDTLGSDVGYERYSFAVVGLFPKFDERFISVVRVAGWVLNGSNVPFYEQTSIGGKFTHRGYGEGRFVDFNGFAASFEERWNLWRYTLMDVEQILQVAGFVDVGRVYGEDESFTLKDLHVAGGGAVRLVVPDSELVASIDMGISDEGMAVFVGLDYPF